ncbi:FtsK/SpoIIIE family DNA translocase [Desulfocucumis palustris]|uniref:FtsK/SpoIIIE family DNA translocase n=1 Tax=Desulfocucumis palustris TaxID=1898651 RepID=UPI000CEA673F|nr:DNA translocase FtsK [Desulfocucumis palustris]
MSGRGRSSSNTKKQNNCPPIRDNIKHQLLGIGLLALSALGVASFFTPTLGMLGNLFERAMLVLAGGGRYFLPVLLALAGYKIMTGGGRLKITARATGVLLLYITLLFYLHLDFLPSQHFPAALEGRGGGITGAAGAYLFKLLFGRVGTYIMLAALTAVSLILITGSTLGHLGMVTALRARAMGSRMGSGVLNFLFEEIEPGKEGNNEKPKSEKNTLLKINQNQSSEVVNTVEAGEDSGLAGNPKPVIKSGNRKKTGDEIAEPIEIAPLSLSDGKVYRLPPVSLLSGPKNKKAGVSNTEISEKTRILEETLDNFGIAARVTEVAVGPAITRYEIQPPPGVKVSRIVGLADDIALGLAAPGVRIEAPIPGKAAVGIEVPNREISMVSLRELVESREFTTPSSRLTVALGKDLAGTPVVADLGKMPHLLVAGATGSGKSVCINTLVSSILYRATPDEVKFLMIDPKMVELTNYNGIPHLISPVVTDAKKAAGTLRWAVKEMEKRYELFAQTGVRDISRYNKLCGASLGESAPVPLPFIVVIIDELADLMMVAPADVEDSICRLAQMARAAGMHLLVATQRPSVDVITGLIKANIPSRISFAVSSQTDSRTILDMGGAEKLLGKGDMLFFPVGVPKPLRLQGAFLSDQEVESMVTYIKEQAEPIYDEQVLKTPPAEGKNDPSGLEDELLPQAVQIFIESGTASISLLQRRLHIGYARAARLVDIMERNGIVGGFEGSKPRSILMSLEQYQQTFNSGSQ